MLFIKVPFEYIVKLVTIFWDCNCPSTTLHLHVCTLASVIYSHWHQSFIHIDISYLYTLTSTHWHQLFIHINIRSYIDRHQLFVHIYNSFQFYTLTSLIYIHWHHLIIYITYLYTSLIYIHWGQWFIHIDISWHMDTLALHWLLILTILTPASMKSSRYKEILTDLRKKFPKRCVLTSNWFSRWCYTDNF